MVEQGVAGVQESIEELRKKQINKDEFIKAHEGVLEYFKDSHDL